MLTIPNVLSPELVDTITSTLDQAEFQDGSRTTANAGSRLKNNLQFPPNAERERLGKLILEAVQQNGKIRWSAFPTRFTFPMFSKYEPGMYYDFHTDAAIMNIGYPSAVRTDLSCTIFLSEPDSYEGGELTIQAPSGTSQIKLPAGSAALYATGNLHRVETVTRGCRVAAVFWIQSYVRDEAQRRVLMRLSDVCRMLEKQDVGKEERDLASSALHDLLRMWAA